MEETSLIQDKTVIVLAILILGLAWLSALSATSRISRLRGGKRSFANLLSLVAGPAGWAVHISSWYRARQEVAEEEPAPSPAPAAPAGAESGLPSPPAPRKRSRWKKRTRAPANPETKAFNDLLLEAVEQQSTDIHFEPHEDHYLLRFRVNGILRDYKTYSRESGERLIAIAKVMASLDVADKLKPQDGRFEWNNAKPPLRLDVRISVSPSLRGEKLALRFLNRPASSLDMVSLGMNEEMQKALKRAVRHPEGFILIAGPTGSGKTSSAYSVLSLLSGSAVNIMTIEDPVEYTLPYATQIAINPKQGITFESGLTSLLRQDPDIILIGEMREADSFRIGIRASLSGHLVISTMHARDSIQVFANLRNLGIDPSSLAAAVKLVVAQRLVRLLCPDCKVPDEDLDEETLEFLGGEPEEVQVYQPGEGCSTCFGSGYTGRTGVFEYITMDAAVREWIERGRHESDLRRSLGDTGFRTMRDDAREKVRAGEVWVQDAIRATGLEVA